MKNPSLEFAIQSIRNDERVAVLAEVLAILHDDTLALWQMQIRVTNLAPAPKEGE